MTDLQAAISLPGASEALAVNNSGQMVGLCKGLASGEMGANDDVWFYHLGDASYKDLTTLSGLLENYTGGKALCSGANLINSDGQVVGEEINATDGYHAAIWDSANGLRDLNTAFSAYLAAWSAANGGATVVLNDATGINDEDAIIGTATINGTASAIVLSPLPGDANGDGRVDVNDLTIVLSHFGDWGDLVSGRVQRRRQG